MWRDHNFDINKLGASDGAEEKENEAERARKYMYIAVSGMVAFILFFLLVIAILLADK
jgi:hypothetical protein